MNREIMPFSLGDERNLRPIWDLLCTIFIPEAQEEMMTLIKLQAERIDELESEVERLGELEQSVMHALKKVKPLDRVIVPDYINKGADDE